MLGKRSERVSCMLVTPDLLELLWSVFFTDYTHIDFTALTIFLPFTGLCKREIKNCSRLLRIEVF